MSKTDFEQNKVFKVLEMYSGIGGMRYALEAANVPYKIVAAIDINTVVNRVYCHNFGSMNHMQRNIQSITVEELDLLGADIVAMSPPCQPFTRVGLKLDSDDPRSESFMHLLNIFCKLQRKPTYILLENVMGFENSSTRSDFINTLKTCGYVCQEFLLSPLQFDIPNSRMRYYAIAKLKPLEFAFNTTDQILHNMPAGITSILYKYPCSKCELSSHMKNKCIIKHVLEENSNSYFDNFKLSDETLLKHGFVLDIIEDTSHSSCCFTKGYMRFHQGTGSILHPTNSLKVSDIYEAVSRINNIEERLKLLKSLNLRYFTPREIANIMCFPHSFNFPEDMTLKQKYRTLGNSINVFVVSNLLKLLLTET